MSTHLLVSVVAPERELRVNVMEYVVCDRLLATDSSFSVNASAMIDAKECASVRRTTCNSSPTELRC
jgi:hypothetical protein